MLVHILSNLLALREDLSSKINIFFFMNCTINKLKLSYHSFILLQLILYISFNTFMKKFSKYIQDYSNINSIEEHAG